MNDHDTVELLLVEGDPEDLELAVRALRNASLASRIEIARDGAEALEFIFCEGAHVARRIADVPRVCDGADAVAFIFGEVSHVERRIADVPRVSVLELKLPKIDGLEVLKRVKSDPLQHFEPVDLRQLQFEHDHPRNVGDSARD